MVLFTKYRLKASNREIIAQTADFYYYIIFYYICQLYLINFHY